jgi:hypothetical protein
MTSPWRSPTRANIVTGYQNRCHRRSCGQIEQQLTRRFAGAPTAASSYGPSVRCGRSLPPHPPYDGLAPHHGGRRPRSGPGDHAPHRPAHHDGVLRHIAPGCLRGAIDRRRRWQGLADIEKYSRSGWGVVQRFAEVGSKFEEFCSYFAPGTAASHERQACWGSTYRATLRRRGRPHPSSLRSDGLQALRARNPRPHSHRERNSRRPGGLGILPGCSPPTRVR